MTIIKWGKSGNGLAVWDPRNFDDRWKIGVVFMELKITIMAKIGIVAKN